MTRFLGLKTEQLNQLYDARTACGDWPGLYGAMKKKSAEFYKTMKGERNIAYSSSPRTTFDFVDCGVENAPTFIFIHGGAWRACEKEDFAFIADGVAKAGVNVLLPEYTLAPQASMTQMANEIGLFLDFVQSHGEKYKIRKDKVVLGGHSAGGHFACVHRHHPIATHVMAISAVTDLTPISLCNMNDSLNLTGEEIEKYSPIRHLRDGVPTSIHNGSDESIESIRQSLSYAEALLATNSKSFYRQIAGCNHFTQLYQFARPEGSLLKALENLLEV